MLSERALTATMTVLSDISAALFPKQKSRSAPLCLPPRDPCRSMDTMPTESSAIGNPSRSAARGTRPHRPSSSTAPVRIFTAISTGDTYIIPSPGNPV